MRAYYLAAHCGLALLFVATTASVNHVLFGTRLAAQCSAALFLTTLIAGGIYIFRPHAAWGAKFVIYCWAGLYAAYALTSFYLHFSGALPQSSAALAMTALSLGFFIVKGKNPGFGKA